MIDQTTTQVQTIPPVTTSVKEQSNLPWPWWAVMLFSVLLGFTGSYLIVWQNLKRLGKENEAHKFLIWGGVIMITLLGIFLFLPVNFSRSVASGMALIFPVWLNAKYLNVWQKENVGKAKFSWSIVGWGLVGLVSYLTLLFILSIFSI